MKQLMWQLLVRLSLESSSLIQSFYSFLLAFRPHSWFMLKAFSLPCLRRPGGLSPLLARIVSAPWLNARALESDL